MLNNDPLVLIVSVMGVALVATLVCGSALYLIATAGSKFFRRNIPSDEDLAKLKTMSLTQPVPRVRQPLSPTMEPLAITGVGLVVFLLLTFMFLREPKVTISQEPEPTPVAKAGLAVKGDLEKIVAALPQGNADAGGKLFVSQGCTACHSQEKDKRVVGPSFYGLYTRAATRQPPASAKAYLYHSIVAPNDYLVPSYQANIMNQGYAAQLSAQQMADILAWIETNHSETD